MKDHIILDYYDIRKISRIPCKSFLLTILFQTIGVATNKMGFLNLTHNIDKLVVFGSTIRGASHTSTLIKKVVIMPYNISILQISKPIISSGIDGAPSIIIVSAPLEKADSLVEAPEAEDTPIESSEDNIVDAPATAPGESANTSTDSPKADVLASYASEEPPTSHKKVIDAPTSTSSRSRLSIGAILRLFMDIGFLRAL
ncbi:putative Fasciclin-like arabinogalactan protein 3 [Cocos nucifera]|uniref:Putative Fasciclin-like arabinogalactan protein 3 n=1 Tax=Cocos nucifera TaxID=13894 RepID=A0A8K0IHP9_COCNU|nr:putative Fasciclin-like arabinogalactan protein 3 [Cocos nucifera]